MRFGKDVAAQKLRTVQLSAWCACSLPASIRRFFARYFVFKSILAVLQDSYHNILPKKPNHVEYFLPRRQSSRALLGVIKSHDL